MGVAIAFNPSCLYAKEALAAEIQETSNLYTTDIHALIKIRTSEDVALARKTIIQFIWADGKLPSGKPDHVERNIQDLRYANLPNLKRLDKIIVHMDFGMTSTIFKFNPLKSNGNVMLFHVGHGEDLTNHQSAIAEFIKKGYTVVGFCLPFSGTNPKYVMASTRFGTLRIESHELMKFLLSPVGHPVRFFLEPVIACVNGLVEEDPYANIYMTGFSGGGWATTLIAAIDPRIKKSYPVAGSYPIFLRIRATPGDYRDLGDWEQTIPELYGLYDYLDLYILGASGKSRRQLQVLNKYDTCCFDGERGKHYQTEVAAHVSAIGEGHYELFIDDSVKGHTLSQAAMVKILKDAQDGTEHSTSNVERRILNFQ
jgi:hypothetical protein